jgi:hypothetical protein
LPAPKPTPTPSSRENGDRDQPFGPAARYRGLKRPLGWSSDHRVGGDTVEGRHPQPDDDYDQDQKEEAKEEFPHCAAVVRSPTTRDRRFDPKSPHCDSRGDLC